MIHVIDLFFRVEHTIASFVIESSEGPILVETGPHSVYPKLVEGLAKLGYQPSDVKHVLLTHIHFDHAGAAWALAKEGATVYVHPVGYPHMKDPERLYGSAKRIYGDMMEPLWGLMEAIPEDLLVAVEDKTPLQIGEHTFIPHYTPGHASHHIAWQLGGTVFTGDVAGAKIDGGPVVPPCPPPDIDLEKWQASLDLLRSLKPESLHLTHYDRVDEVEQHLDELEKALTEWGTWIKQKWEEGLSAQEITPQFVKYVADFLTDAGADKRTLSQYEAANPAYMSVSGLMRYWKKKAEREAADS